MISSLTPTHLNYYFTCPRKLWFFNKRIQCEWESDLVKIGKIYHEDSKDEEVEIDNFKIDKFRDGKVFELKKRNSAPEAAKFQVLYYLYLLRKKGIFTTGIIKYKENNRIEEVELTKENEQKLLQALFEAHNICAQATPPSAKRIKHCKKCSYFELCYS